jgi:hypothetical protein
MARTKKICMEIIEYFFIFFLPNVYVLHNPMELMLVDTLHCHPISSTYSVK